MRFDCWLLGEVELVRLVAMSIGDAADGISSVSKSGVADGNRGTLSGSSSSWGNNTSSLVKLSAIA